jgi:hypothetical protein
MGTGQGAYFVKVREQEGNESGKILTVSPQNLMH